jgi:MFS family permease
LMAAGALADQFGRKRLFVFGLGGFIAALSYSSLLQGMPGGHVAGAGLTARMSEAAQRMTAGDTMHAAAVLPEMPPHALALSYTHAFTSLLHVLIVITLLSAFAAFAFLSRTGPHDEDHGEPQTEDKNKARNKTKVADSALA